MFKRIKFVGIPVRDQDRALAFWKDVMGFQLVTDQPMGGGQRWIELGIPGADTRVVLFRTDEGPKPGGSMNIVFWTDDVESTARDLEQKGVEFTVKPQKESWGTFAIFKDVDENKFVLGTK